MSDISAFVLTFKIESKILLRILNGNAIELFKGCTNS